MGRPADNTIKLSETLSLSEFKSGGSKGFWLYDKTRGMNLSMRAESETAAFVEALGYYQERLKSVEQARGELAEKVNAFLSQFSDECEVD